MKPAPFALALALLLATPRARAHAAPDEPQPPIPEPARIVPVWPDPDAAPGENPRAPVGPERVLPDQPGQRVVRRITDVARPEIAHYPAPGDRANGAAVLVCPGGGYNILAWDLEGVEVAQWLNSLGVHAFVLKYRVPRRPEQPKHLAPLRDAQRALSLLRARADEFRIDPARLGILGFSAGGHLAATAATNADRRAYQPLDQIDDASCRPDFAILVYPAYLVGEIPPDQRDKHAEKPIEQRLALAPEIRIGPDSPPMFLAHAQDDPLTPENSVAAFLALKAAGVPAELHVYAHGGHGFGLRPAKDPAPASWPRQAAAWMARMGWIE